MGSTRVRSTRRLGIYVVELTRGDPPVKEFLRACPPSDDAPSADGAAAGESKARRVPLSRERVLTAALPGERWMLP